MTGIAGIDPYFMGQVVVEPKVGTLRTSWGEVVTLARALAEGLLHAEDWFETSEPAIGTVPLRQAIGCFHPIALGMRTVSVFGADL